MHARLIEDWLDSANERTYQPAFCQMLVADGHRVVHSTRHSPIELGKDVISINAEGQLCAFQLKGNPGGRLTSNQLREILPQLRQLIDLAILSDGVPDVPHRSFLVTNGLVEEEATLEIEQLNHQYRVEGYEHRKLEVIERGTLLDMAKRLGYELWPSGNQDLHLLLQILIHDGQAPFPSQRMADLLAPVLALGSAKETWTAGRLRRQVSSGALLTSLALKNFVSTRNHAAIVAAWTQFAVASMGSCDRLRRSFDVNGKPSADLASQAILDALVDLALEVLERDTLAEGDQMLDSAFVKARWTLVLALLSVLWMWLERDGWPDDLAKSDLESFLRDGRPHLYLWGEAAIPQVLAYYWCIRGLTAGVSPDILLEAMIAAVSSTDERGDAIGLASPYHDYHDLARHQLAPILGFHQDPMLDEPPTNLSYFASSLFSLLVRTNLKNECKRLWPNLSRCAFVEFEPKYRWQYCLPHSSEGVATQTLPPLTRAWQEAIDEARIVGCESVPSPLLEQPLLHLLYIICFPYRAQHSVIRRLGWKLNPVWFLPPPLE